MKNFLIAAILISTLVSCEKQEIGLRDQNEFLLASWLDIGQLWNGNPVNSSSKGAIITFNEDGTFQSPNEDKIFGIGTSGKWVYDDSSKKIVFEYEADSISTPDNYNINKFWIVNNFENNVLDVTQCFFREKSNIVNPLTNEIIQTIDPVDIKIWRRLQKQD